MNKELQYIIATLMDVLEGEPWYGSSAYRILSEVNPSKAFEKPGENTHSQIELLYHMIAWARFTEECLLSHRSSDPDQSNAMDWPKIDPSVHSWKDGMDRFKSVHSSILMILEKKEDFILDEKLSIKPYNFRFLFDGMIQHIIYHIGQLAYLNKLLG